MNLNDYHPQTNFKKCWQGALAILPLCIAVIPWGFLAGSYAIDSGLTIFEAQAMSAVLFAGSAQLVAIGMFKEEVGLATLLLTTFFITSRHFLYSIAMRQKVSKLSGRWRLLLGFLLTDEMFAVCSTQSEQAFNPWYALGAGGMFYLVWNLASFVGIIAGSQIASLNDVGLDFAVAATFIALVVPQVISIPIVVAVIVSLISAVALHVYDIESGLMIASILGIISGYVCELMFIKYNLSGIAETTAEIK